jgi:UDP-N-acetylglucosamine acyltransferase
VSVTEIHPTVIVDSSAVIAEGVEIGPYSVIGADVEIASGTVIGPHVVINGPTKIGRDNHIFQFASIGECPQDLKYDGERTTLEIGERNRIREFVTLHRGTVGGGGVTRIGSDNLLMAYVHVAHDCIVGEHTILANNASIAGHVVVGDYAILGGFTTVHQFTRIGAHCFTGFATAIDRDVLPYFTVAGNRARAVGINKEGLNRRGFTAAAIRALQEAFKLLVKSEVPMKTRLEKVEVIAAEHVEVAQLLTFLRASERGWIR